MEDILATTVKKEFNVITTAGAEDKPKSVKKKDALKLQSGAQPKNTRIKDSEELTFWQIASIMNAIKKSSAQKPKEKKTKAEENEPTAKEEQKPSANPDYDSKKSYGIMQSGSYVDYEKLFSYLGKFKATNPYFNNPLAENNNSSEHSVKATLIDLEIMDKGAKYVKYFFPKTADFHSRLGSLVPVAGMSSGEWEQFKLWVTLDPVMYLLKTTIN